MPSECFLICPNVSFSTFRLGLVSYGSRTLSGVFQAWKGAVVMADTRRDWGIRVL